MAKLILWSMDKIVCSKTSIYENVVKTYSASWLIISDFSCHNKKQVNSGRNA